MENVFFRKKSLMLQLAVVITLLITIVDSALYLISYQSKKNELIQIRESIQQNLAKHTEKPFPEVFPHLLSDADIDNRLADFSINVFGLVILMIMFVVIGTIFTFYYFVGRNLFLLKKLNEQCHQGNFLYFPKERIPENDLGDVILDRNKMLKNIEGHQNNLEHDLEEVKLSLIHTAKLSTIGELTSSIAHDLNNPLSVNIASLTMLERAIATNDLDLAQNVVEKIRFSNERIKRLVDRMGKFSRQDFSLEQNVQIPEVIDNAIILVGHKVYTNNIQIETKFEDNLNHIMADSGSLEQVFTNILSNAADALLEVKERRIIIDVTNDDDYVNISIKDTGPGVPKEIQQKIFCPFYTSKPEGKGTGLGLSISNQIISTHKGEFILNEQYKKGAEFIIRLPLNPANVEVLQLAKQG